MMFRWLLVSLVFLSNGWNIETSFAQKPGTAVPPKRLLLLYQKPDGHPKSTHEYQRGLTRLKELLAGNPQIEARLVPADEPWNDGPDHLDGADGVVLFLSEGAKFVSADPARKAAFERLAKRKAGLSCLHWGMGTKSSQPIETFTRLFGGCHGGPDRQYKFLETVLRPAAPPLPITSGLNPVRLKEEFYYNLKWADADPPPRPVMEAEIDGRWWPVAWTWERPDGGRSFGFSGLHYDENWKQPVYETLISRGVLWTLRSEKP